MKLALISGGCIIAIISLLIFYSFGFALFNDMRLRHIFKKNSYKVLTALYILGTVGVGMSLATISKDEFETS